MTSDVFRAFLTYLPTLIRYFTTLAYLVKSDEALPTYVPKNLTSYMNAPQSIWGWSWYLKPRGSKYPREWISTYFVLNPRISYHCFCTKWNFTAVIKWFNTFYVLLSRNMNWQKKCYIISKYDYLCIHCSNKVRKKIHNFVNKCTI